MSHPPLNQGDDVAGIVAAVGPDVTDFAVGDRVAALHQPGTEWGTYAEYTLVWSYATFRIPETMGFAEASTMPMAAVTAAVGLYKVLELPCPGTSSATQQPVVIYGASSAVGAFAVKLAALGGLHPIIAVAGAGSGYVRTLLDYSKGDLVVDYRNGEAEIVGAVTSALQRQGLQADLAFDTVPNENSQRLLGKVLVAFERRKPKHLASVLPLAKVDGFPEEKVRRTFVTSPIIFQKNETEGGDRDANHTFGKRVVTLFAKAIQDGRLTGHPYEIIPGGLEGIETGLKNLQSGKNSAKKYVYEIGKQ